MPFTFKSFTNIFQDMTQELSAQGSALTDLNPGSRIHAIIRSFGSALSAAWIALVELRNLFFINSSYGIDLERRLGDFGMDRKPGSYATGRVIAHGLTVGQDVSLGSRISTADGTVVLDVLANAVLTSDQLIPVVASSIGSKYNLPEGTQLYGIDGTLSNISFVVATNGLDTNNLPTGSLSGGSDAESDDQLKLRFSSYLKSLSRGTRLAIEQALNSINGIGSIVVEEAVPVPGWITVTIADDSGVLTDTLKTAAEIVLNDWGAAGMGVLIKPITRTVFNLEVNAYCSDASITRGALETAVALRLTDRFSNLAIGESVYPDQVTTAATLDTLRNTICISPSVAVLAAPGELLGLGQIKVNVFYV